MPPTNFWAAFCPRGYAKCCQKLPRFVPGVGITAAAMHPPRGGNILAAFCPKGLQNFAAKRATICPRCRDNRVPHYRPPEAGKIDRNISSRMMRNISAAFCPKGLQNFCCRMGGVCPTCRDDWVERVSSQNGATEPSVNVAKGSFLRSTSPDSHSVAGPGAPCGEAAVTSAESGVCEARQRMFKRPELRPNRQPRGRARAYAGHIPAVRLRGVLRLHEKQHWEEFSPVPPGRLAAPR